MKVRLIFMLFVLMFSFSFVYALTGSIGNARMILYPKVGFLGTIIDKSILVKNVNNVSVDVKLEASEEFKGIVEIADKEFSLEAGDEKNAEFRIKLKKAGDYEGKINVFFTSAGEKAGVALSSTIIIHASKTGRNDDSGDSEDGSNESVNLDDGDSITSANSGNLVGNSSSFNALYLLLILPFILAVILIFMLIKLNRRKKRR